MYDVRPELSMTRETKRFCSFHATVRYETMQYIVINTARLRHLRIGGHIQVPRPICFFFLPQINLFTHTNILTVKQLNRLEE